MNTQAVKLSIILLSSIFLFSTTALADDKDKVKKKTKPPGWEQGEKTGWDGKDAPPGLSEGKLEKKQEAKKKNSRNKGKAKNKGEKVKHEAEPEKAEQEAEIEGEKKKQEAEMEKEKKKLKSNSKKKRG